jgi:DNA replication protein DnaC
VSKTLESFDFAEQPSINQPLIRELMSGEYIEKRENVLLISNSGTGKTHLATALAFGACQQGRKVRFYSATGMVTTLLERREERELERFNKQLERLELIVLDGSSQNLVGECTGVEGCVFGKWSNERHTKKPLCTTVGPLC